MNKKSENLIPDGVYGEFGSQTVEVEDGVVVYHDAWAFREEYGIATQEVLDEALKDAEEVYKEFELSTTDEI